MTGHRKKPHPRQAEAGAANLRAYREKVGGRPALKHGVDSLLRTGQPPPGREEVAARADAIVREMVTDLGGDSEVTAQRRAILESQRMCLQVLMLAGDYLRREGLIGKNGKPHRLLGVVVSFANTLRLNAVALGLERRAKNVTTLDGVLREYAEKPQQDAHEKTNS